jgi:hypothetical protein
MTLEKEILRDLTSGRSTADSIAQRIKHKTEAVEATLAHLVNGKKVTTSTLGPLIIYHLVKTIP